MLPFNRAPVHTNQLDHMAGMSLLDTALFNSNQGRKVTPTTGSATANLYQQVHGTALPSINQTQAQPSQQLSHVPMSPGSPFNPAAPIFRSVLQPNREAEYRNKSERLLRTLDEQNAVIVALQEELVNTASDLTCAIKDMRDVAKALKEGQTNGIMNVKKLIYRSTDLENVVKRQENWRLRLEQVAMPDVSRA